MPDRRFFSAAAPIVNGVAVYVATHLLDGHALFDVLGDGLVADRLGEHPFLLDELAGDPIVRGVVARPAKGELRRSRSGHPIDVHAGRRSRLPATGVDGVVAARARPEG